MTQKHNVLKNTKKIAINNAISAEVAHIDIFIFPEIVIKYFTFQTTGHT